MSGAEKVVRHLEMIQRIVDRLSGNSFTTKTQSLAALIAGIFLVLSGQKEQMDLLLVFLIPVAGFWALDAYFLRQQRVFRLIYEDIRTRSTTDFKMDIRIGDTYPDCWTIRVAFSTTLSLFYGTEMVFIVVTWCIAP